MNSYNFIGSQSCTVVILVLGHSTVFHLGLNIKAYYFMCVNACQRKTWIFLIRKCLEISSIFQLFFKVITAQCSYTIPIIPWNMLKNTYNAIVMPIVLHANVLCRTYR